MRASVRDGSACGLVLGQGDLLCSVVRGYLVAAVGKVGPLGLPQSHFVLLSFTTNMRLYLLTEWQKKPFLNYRVMNLIPPT